MIISFGEKQTKTSVPDFMLIGAAKSGTTTLYKMLDQSEDIFFPKSRKEPFYFSFAGNQPEYLDNDFKSHIVWKTEDYLGLYESNNKNQLLGDASTSYLYLAERTIQNIKNFYGKDFKKIKILILLRNPVDRAYSHYTYLIRNGFEKLSFEEAILPEIIQERKKIRWGFDYLEYGNYYDQVSAYAHNFPSVKVITIEELKNSKEVICGICDFLGIKQFAPNTNINANPSGVPRNRFLVNLIRKNSFLKSSVNLLPEKSKNSLLNRRDQLMKRFLKKETMKPETRQKLISYYRDNIKNLEQLLKRDLTDWYK